MDIPDALKACFEDICDVFFRRVSWVSSDDVEAPEPAAIEEFARCITFYFDETTGCYTHVQFPDAPVICVGSELTCEDMEGWFGCKTERVGPAVFNNDDDTVWNDDPANQNQRICWSETDLPTVVSVNTGCLPMECTAEYDTTFTIYQGVTPPGPAGSGGVPNALESHVFLSIQSDFNGSTTNSAPLSNRNFGGVPGMFSTQLFVKRGPTLVPVGASISMGGRVCFMNNGPDGFIPERVALRGRLTCCTVLA